MLATPRCAHLPWPLFYRVLRCCGAESLLALFQGSRLVPEGLLRAGLLRAWQPLFGAAGSAPLRALERKCDTLVGQLCARRARGFEPVSFDSVRRLLLGEIECVQIRAWPGTLVDGRVWDVPTEIHIEYCDADLPLTEVPLTHRLLAALLDTQDSSACCLVCRAKEVLDVLYDRGGAVNVVMREDRFFLQDAGLDDDGGSPMFGCACAECSRWAWVFSEAADRGWRPFDKVAPYRRHLAENGLPH